MGVGVFYMNDAETVIVDHESVYGEWNAANPYGYAAIEHEDDFRFCYRDFLDHLTDCLSATWRPVRDGWRDRVSAVIAENAFFQLCVTDWECDFYVSLALRGGFDTSDGYHPLARANQRRIALAFFVRLAECYPLRVRTGGYTTASWQPRPATAA